MDDGATVRSFWISKRFILAKLGESGGVRTMVQYLLRWLGLAVGVLRWFPVAEVNLPPRMFPRMPDDFSALSEIGEALRGNDSLNLGTCSDLSLSNTLRGVS